MAVVVVKRATTAISRRSCDRIGDVLVLRTVTTDDWHLWRDIRVAALIDSPHAFVTRVENWHRGVEQRWRERLEMPDAHNLVALLDGRAVGLASGLPTEEHADECAGEVRSVWVDPAARGRGVGDRLLTEIESWARQNGMMTLRLGVMVGNEPAAALYRRRGFVVTGMREHPTPTGVLHEQRMEKALR